MEGSGGQWRVNGRGGLAVTITFGKPIFSVNEQTPHLLLISGSFHPFIHPPHTHTMADMFDIEWGLKRYDLSAAKLMIAAWGLT